MKSSKGAKIQQAFPRMNASKDEPLKSLSHPLAAILLAMGRLFAWIEAEFQIC